MRFTSYSMLKPEVHVRSWVAVLCFLLVACSDAPEQRAESPDSDTIELRGREACTDRAEQRNVFFGDLHVHTGLSMDAYISGTRAGPDEAYRFARGEEIGSPPLDERGQPTLRVRIDRPLDFAAVTDHAENLGPVALCTRADSAVYDTPGCLKFRTGKMKPGPLLEMIRQITERTEPLTSEEVCGPDGERCREAVAEPWLETQSAAERWYDRSASCDFTTFVAYEYTYTPELSKIHRNVIFRNEVVLDRPISSDEEPDAHVLWRRLRDECLEAGNGCDVLAIPHNPNLSNGRMFALDYGEATSVAEQADRASLRAELEPLLEMTQIKGDSECRGGMWNVLGDTDELCGYEKLRTPEQPADCEEATGVGALLGEGCVSRLDFARYVLLEGLREADRLGINPYKLGFIGSTDTHAATPGDVAEWIHDGVGRRFRGDLRRNPGGLIAVWAEENSRDSLFAAMRRRETYATSGPRMAVRMFGGWDYPQDLCGDQRLVEKGYAGGVPMGADLPGRPGEAAAPQFVVSAMRDAGTPAHPGGLLQRIQMIKGWVGDDGRFHQAVYDVAGDASAAADVDPETCAPRGPGAEQLCAVWRDPDFDPERRAVYYARVVENPSCRWTVDVCRNRTGEERPALCDEADLPRTIQERAWTSPIWYAP